MNALTFLPACLLLAAPAPPPAPPDPAPPAASQPATAPAGRPVRYAPGILINWPARQVEIDAEICLREGPLELLACSPDTKEHESILRVHARPRRIFEALGLLGLQPGHPARWLPDRQTYEPAEGDEVEISVRFDYAGTTQTIDAWVWLRPTRPEAGPARGTWIFAGSAFEPDGRFAADLDGTVVTVVTFGTEIIGLKRFHSASNDELWLEANTPNIPPVGTPCTLIIRPAAKDRQSLRLDRFGRLLVYGRPVAPAEFFAALPNRLARHPGLRFTIDVESLEPGPRLRWFLRRLAEHGVPRDRIWVRYHRPAPAPAASPDGLVEWLEGLANGRLARYRQALRRAAEWLEGLSPRGEALLDEVARIQAQVRQTQDRLERALRPRDAAHSKTPR